MTEKSVPPASSVPTPSRPGVPPRPASASNRDDVAWNPKIDRERTLHGFEGRTPEADSILESPKVRDPEEDTAPLQGSKDRSDEDSLEPGERLETDE
jgi:hypothetical protein